MPQITYFQILILIRKLKVIRGVKVLSCRLIPIKMYSFYIFFLREYSFIFTQRLLFIKFIKCDRKNTKDIVVQSVL